MVPRMHRSKAITLALFSLFALAALPVADAAAKKKKTTPKVKLFQINQKTTTVPDDSATDRMFKNSQEIRAKCGRGFYPLSIGVSSATNSLAAQDLGFYGMGVFVDGAAGTAKTKLQALCAKGGRMPYYGGSFVKLGSDPVFGQSVVATLKCPRGTVALGAAFAHGHAPAIGGYRMYPVNARQWSYAARIDNYNASAYKDRIGDLGYPRMGCVRATGVTIEKVVGLVGQAVPFQETVNCKRGRTLGWGIEESPYRSYSGNDGRWVTPVVEQARFVGTKSMKFVISRGGDSSGYARSTDVTVHVVCGKLPKG